MKYDWPWIDNRSSWITGTQVSLHYYHHFVISLKCSIINFKKKRINEHYIKRKMPYLYILNFANNFGEFKSTKALLIDMGTQVLNSCWRNETLKNNFTKQSTSIHPMIMPFKEVILYGSYIYCNDCSNQCQNSFLLYQLSGWY